MESNKKVKLFIHLLIILLINSINGIVKADEGNSIIKNSYNSNVETLPDNLGDYLTDKAIAFGGTFSDRSLAALSAIADEVQLIRLSR